VPTDKPAEGDTDPPTSNSEAGAPQSEGPGSKRSSTERLGSLDHTRQQTLVSAFIGSVSIVLSVTGIFAEDLTGTPLRLLQGTACFLGVGTVLALFAPLVRDLKRFALLILLVACVPVLVAVFLPQLRDVFNPSCDDPIELTVAVPSESAEGLAEAPEAAGFSDVVEAFAEGRLDDNDCRTVNATTIPISDSEGRDAFADDWEDTTQGTSGARPNVWIAESAAQIDTARSLMEDDAPLGGEPIAIGRTPLVLAVPSNAAVSAMAAEEAFTVLAEDGLVVRPDPELSLTGLYHLNWIYALEQDDSDVEQMIEDGLERLGVGGLDDPQLLCRLFGSEDDATAVLTTERTMAIYNSEKKLDCSKSGQPAALLTALYPADAGSLDYTALVLDWPDPAEADSAIESERDRIAEEFVAWLLEPRGQEKLDEIGVRRIDGGGSAFLSAVDGVDVDVPAEGLAPTSERLEGLDAKYEEARKPTRVLLAVDNSGSMVQTAGSSGETLAEIAVTGADQALGSFGAEDQLGLWAFPDGDRLEPNVLMPVGPANEENHTRAVELLEGLVPEGDTPLYHTIAEGVSELDRPEDPVKPVMVVLTDGLDDDSAHDIGIDDLTAQVEATDVRLYVITVGSATCESTGLDELALASLGRCDSVQAQSLEAAFQDVFDQIWGGDA
jgi:hypothetical protein